MKGNGDDHNKTRFVKLPMGSNGTNVYKAVCLQDFDDTPIRFGLHAKTGSMMSVSSHLGGNQYRVDVEASVIASGMMTEDGSFLLNRNKYIGLNQELKIHSKYVSFTVVVTDIAEAQS